MATTGTTIDRARFEAELKRDGYDVLTNTTPGVKMNPQHSHPFDVRAMVLKGALTLSRLSALLAIGLTGERARLAAGLSQPRQP